MGIVRRCGRPPRPAPLIQKPTRERVALHGRPAPASPAGGLDALASLAAPRRASRELDAAATARLVAATTFTPAPGRRPPRIPAALGTMPGASARGEDAAGDDILCGCRRHR